MLNLLLTYLLFIFFDGIIKEALKSKPKLKLKNLTSNMEEIIKCPLGFGKVNRGCNFIEETLLTGENKMVKDLLSSCCPHNANKTKTREETNIDKEETNIDKEESKIKLENKGNLHKEETKEDKIKKLFSSGMDLLKNFETITKSEKNNIDGEKNRNEEILEPLLKFFHL